MTSWNRAGYPVCLALLAIFGVAIRCVSQTSDDFHVLSSPADQTTAVRFFFDPGNYFHAPLIFRVVAPNDTRLNTAPLLKEGRTAYITAPEMDRLKESLLHMGLSWKESIKMEVFGDATKIIPLYKMAIDVTSSKGTARSGFNPAEICKNLAPLDSSLTTPRALWEFQVFRAEYQCKVPGLNGQAYPNHWSR